MSFFVHMVAQSLRRRFSRMRITFLAIAFSAAIIVLLQGLLAGVHEAMIRNAVAIQAGHVQASWSSHDYQGDKLIADCQALPGVRAALMRSRSIGLLTGGVDRHALATVYGVDPQRERRQTIIAGKIIAGDYLARPGDIVIGAELAGMLQVEVGQTVTFHPSVTAQRTYRVGGIFRTGLGEMDRLLAFAHRQADCDSQEVSLFLDHPDEAATVAEQVKGVVPAEARVQDWRELMPNLVQLLAFDEAAANIVTVLVLAILAFGISNTVFISVSQRTREFGILRSMGMTPGGVTLLVLAESGVLAAAGGLAGAGLGAVLVWACNWAGGLDLSIWTSLNPLFAGSTVVQPRMTAASVLLPVAVTIACGLLAGLLPARRAGRIAVVESLRSL